MKVLPIIGITTVLAANSLPACANPNPHKDKSLPPGIEKSMNEQVNYRRVGKKS